MLKRYRKKGADKASKLLIEAISSHKNGDTSLLDVGGGVGTIQIAMLNRGVTQATNVEASPAYQVVAKEEAAQQGIKERIHYCPVKSRIESVGWGHRVSFRGSRTAARPVKWAFSRKG